MAERAGNGGSRRALLPDADRAISPRILAATAITVVALGWIGITEVGDSTPVLEGSSTSPTASADEAGLEGAPPASGPTTAAPATTTAPVGRTGVFVAAPASEAVFGTSGDLVTFSVAVEEAAGMNPVEFAEVVDAALSDPRSWMAEGLRFQRVADGTAGVRVVLATPPTVDELCLPLQTNGRYSCRQGNQLNINLDRWLHGTEEWPLDLEAYRAHVINHEVGHALGHGHVGCPGAGEVAPVMMQQTKGLEGCVANPWPHPEVAVPDAEAG